MGAYDLVTIVCPSCGVKEMVQTKEGARTHQVHELNEVPGNIAFALIGQTFVCRGCKAEWLIAQPKVVLLRKA